MHRERCVELVVWEVVFYGKSRASDRKRKERKEEEV
jgi:hypothetical protein